MADINKAVQWFEDRKGKLTYSMEGSRNGSDGTADCSGGASTALKTAGYNIQGLPSTVTLGTQLAANKFTKLNVANGWDAKKGDVILMSWGSSMASSGGAGGHVGLISSNDPNAKFISVDYWTGGQAGTAVSEHAWNDYYNTEVAGGLQYIEVWRAPATTTSAPAAKPAPAKPAAKPAVKGPDQVLEVGSTVQIPGVFKVDGLFTYAPGKYYVRNNGISVPTPDFNNDIPVESVDEVDAKGNKTKDQDFTAGSLTANAKNTYFSFGSRTFKVAEVDDATDSARLIINGENVWLKCKPMKEVKEA